MNQEPDIKVDIQPEQLIWLETDRLAFHFRGTAHPVSLTIAGDRSWLSVQAARAFPQRQPEHYIQLFTANPDGTRGDPIGLIRHLNDLKGDNRATLEDCLRRGHLVPKVLAILALNETRYRSTWVVETDRGERTFEMRRAHRSVFYAGGSRVLMVDAEDNNYEIPDRTRLDPASQRFLDRVL
ncbi:MAG: DUF1854 domain-containing protein [Puniceicoccaceae bacterium]|nr:MAG: DUF1854 domain-containing protein [Puniceicoccaceae bacterium]